MAKTYKGYDLDAISESINDKADRDMQNTTPPLSEPR